VKALLRGMQNGFLLELELGLCFTQLCFIMLLGIRSRLSFAGGIEFMRYNFRCFMLGSLFFLFSLLLELFDVFFFFLYVYV
jgi:hypothetical protein